MSFKIQCFCIEKKVPLVISRGPTYHGMNVFLQIDHGGLTGVGETVLPSDATEQDATALMQKVSSFLHNVKDYSPIDLWQQAYQANMSADAMMLIDSAAWDLLARKANLPLYQLLGLNSDPVKTSITVSIGQPDWVYQRASDILKTYAPGCLKVKLGSPEGIQADKDSFLAVKAAINDVSTPQKTQMFVDANGGWSLSEAKHMMQWLKEAGAIYVEQPLAQGKESDLPELYHRRPLPLYVDESVHFAADVKPIVHCVDGVNIKLVKSGGITEALRILHTVRAFDLKCMIGCFSESPHAIATALSIAGLCDYVDLDAFLNLKNADQVCSNNRLIYDNGYLHKPDKPGIGVIHAI